MRFRGPRPVARICFVDGCGADAAYRVVSPEHPFWLRLACKKCRDELVDLCGWEAVR